MLLGKKWVQPIFGAYYSPFGATISALSSKAPLSKPNHFKYNGKELDNDFDLGWYNYGARMYDPIIARFPSIDPLADSYEFQTPYAYAANNPIRWIDVNGEGPGDPVRLLFYGGSIRPEDNSTFQWAAKNVAGDYTDGQVRVLEAKSSDYISNTINEQDDNSVASLDIFTHGSTVGLFMYEGSAENNVSMYDSWATKLVTGSNIKKGAGTIKDIDFDKFTDNAVIELHGCRSCAPHELSNKLFDVDNIAQDLSQKLSRSGKKNAVVIGHSKKSGPLINGEGKTSNAQQDYRHGPRVVYHAGEVLFTTRKKGRIRRKTINQYLARKREEDDYDGNNENYE